MNLRSNLIVGVLYDIESDEHVFLHADGHQRAQPYEYLLAGLASEYSTFLSRLNEFGGLYRDAYEAAVQRFARLAA